MSLKKILVLALLAGSSLAQASPVINVDAGYTQFHLENEVSGLQNRGGSVYDLHQNNYDSGSAVLLGAEAVFESGESLDFFAGASLAYSSDTEVETEATAISTNTYVTGFTSLDETWLAGLRGGLRWHHDFTPAFSFHADGAISFNQLSTSYDTGFSTENDSDRYFAVDAALGFYYAFTPALTALLDVSAQYDNEYRNRQYTAGLRYSFR